MPPAILARQYRSRKQKPCDLCRKRRVCCLRHEGQDSCALCLSRSLQCRFDSAAQPKWASKTREQLQPDSTRQQSRTAASRHHNAEDDFNDTPKANRQPSSTWNKNHGDHQATTKTVHWIGLSSDQDPWILQHRNRQQGAGDQNRQHQNIGTDPGMPAHFEAFSELYLDTHPPYYPEPKFVAEAEPYRDALCSNFVNVVLTSFPILSQNVSQVLQEASPSMLASIYVLAHQFTPQAHSIDPKSFMDFNKQALPIEMRSAKLETIEAALLFTQRPVYDFRYPGISGMCSEIGSILGMAFDLGLNVDPTRWNISSLEKSRRRRLWWGVYMQDKWLALTLGRPSFITEDQCNVDIPSRADFEAEPRPRRSTTRSSPGQTFIAMATLTVILSDIMQTFYSLGGMKRVCRANAEVISGLEAGLDNRLEMWRTTYLEPVVNEGGFPDPSGTVELAFYTCKITLYRAVIPKIEKRGVASEDARRKATKICAAVIQLLETLPIRRISAFWWSVSRMNLSIAGSFMIAMFLSSTNDVQTNYWSSQISLYRKLLQAHSTSFTVTKLAAIRLELLSGDNAASEDVDTVSASPEPEPSAVVTESRVASEFHASAYDRNDNCDLRPLENDADWLSYLPNQSPFGSSAFWPGWFRNSETDVNYNLWDEGDVSMEP